LGGNENCRAQKGEEKKKKSFLLSRKKKKGEGVLQKRKPVKAQSGMAGPTFKWGGEKKTFNQASTPYNRKKKKPQLGNLRQGEGPVSIVNVYGPCQSKKKVNQGAGADN